MHLLLADNYDAWKQDPAGFFNRHRDLFKSIIRKQYFRGHLNDDELEETIGLIGQRMNGSTASKSLNTYSRKATFLIFYIKILDSEIIAFSQEEDILLLNTAPRILFLKYKPLVSFILAQIATTRKHVAVIKHDLEQELMLELISKTAYIKKHYKPNMLFRNYVWSIIYYSLLNQLKSKKWKRFAGDSLDQVFEMTDQATDHDFIFCLHDGFRQLAHIMHSYEKQRPKLELFLKIVFSIPVSCSDLYVLFKHEDEPPPKEEIEKACMDLNYKNQAAGFNQTERFAIVSRLLNRAFNKKTKTDSFLHWVNEQIQKIIEKLNTGGARCFNRETFAMLLEMYFMKYCDGNALNNGMKVVNIGKEIYRK